ncbi:MAG TPA: hypothetical protein VNW68_07880, partial [Candidatus Limnocylindria bacterium]|nr:hypothetical protein [Candidatus Limnocylindria bacterium]
RMTAQEQLELGVIDEVVPEPAAGAHEQPEETARLLRSRIVIHLDALAGMDRQALVEARYARYRQMGKFTTVATAVAGRAERVGIGDRIRQLFEGRRPPAGEAGGQPAAVEPPPAGEAASGTDGDEDAPLREDV